jgi:deoxyribonuclease-4
LKRIIRALDEVHRQTRGIATFSLLETTAGQGTALGWRFDHLATILDGVKDPDRLGVCFDTCHVFAAGYPLAPEKDYRATMRKLNASVGVKRIRVFHLNDSKAKCGCVGREWIATRRLGPGRWVLNLSDVCSTIADSARSRWSWKPRKARRRAKTWTSSI